MAHCRWGTIINPLQAICGGREGGRRDHRIREHNVIAVNHRVSPVGNGQKFNQHVIVRGQPNDAGDVEVRAHRRRH